MPTADEKNGTSMVLYALFFQTSDLLKGVNEEKKIIHLLFIYKTN